MISSPGNEKIHPTDQFQLQSSTPNDESESVNDFLDSLSTMSDQANLDDVDDQNQDNQISSFNAGGLRGSGRKQWKSQTITDNNTQPSIQLNDNNNENDDNNQEATTFSANRELWQKRANSQTQLTPQVPPTTPKNFRASQEFREMRQKHTPDLVMDLPLAAQDASKKSASSSSLNSSDDENSLVPPTRNGSEKSPSNGPESPDMSTAAERFAKQNQCTLKKNTKSGTNANNSTDTGRIKSLVGTDGEINDHAGNIKDNIVRSASNNEISSDNVPLRSPLPPRSTPMIAAKFADMRLTGGSQQVSSFKPQVKVKPTILRKPVVPFPHPHMSPELARKIEKQVQGTD